MSDTLQKISELARTARDKAGQMLAGANADKNEISGQLELLNQYRTEYNEKLQEAMMGGIDRLTLSDYQSFLSSLDGAIDKANTQLSDQNHKVLACTESWQKEHRRVASFDTLSDRQQSQERKAEQRNERRDNDELNNNIAARKALKTLS